MTEGHAPESPIKKSQNELSAENIKASNDDQAFVQNRGGELTSPRKEEPETFWSRFWDRVVTLISF